MKHGFFYIAFIAAIALLSCKKDSFITSSNARLYLSSDSLYFDTLFTSTGSVTQGIKIVNGNNQKLKISSLRLSGGNASAFKLNIDGAPVPEANDIELEANDSMYVFVAVTINPNAADLPFIVRDSILLSFNGNKQYIQLSAWGQNAHFVNNGVITSNTTWANDKPYIILGGLQVAASATLSIEKGCRIYAHSNAAILIDGTLKVHGEKYDSTRVVFAGDRLDDPYKNYPGSWPGIYFRASSTNNELQYATIKNAYQGLILQQPQAATRPNVTLRECIIDNITDAGVLAANSSLLAENCLFSNCGKNIAVQYGGDYNFVHCTVVSISNAYVLHLDPVVSLSSSTLKNGNTLSAALQSSFINCIIWGESGNMDDEVVVNKEGSNSFDVSFTNCLWKVSTTPANATAVNVFNEPPAFDSINTSRQYYNFRLKETSPAINKGINTGLANDLDGNNRAVGLPDLGCYEHQ